MLNWDVCDGVAAGSSLSCGADWKLTGDAQAKTDALHAARLLMGRFNPRGFIRAWNAPERVGYAIIDCMMNLSIETGTIRNLSVRFQSVLSFMRGLCPSAFPALIEWEVFGKE